MQDALRDAWFASSLHPMRRRRLPSLEVLLNPPRPVKGKEKERLDREFEEMKAWATAIPVLPLKGTGTKEKPGVRDDG